ncbi:DUF2938 family protein [Pseudoalteromonas luteoviolacea]|uniref:DUF2938 domain-containing protein n=1 Tax=Pseudoalteromonas luteoviolacea S4054 TaxID=1129367 RepID=A0A0F6A5C4_9GAMM|nr:DUF2938 family protein [Pseudoalteromonas luteoviolacea]AOT10454.1 hypothetical protein S4054249_21530 [Pseudoalteromonas luteoviolacea]AOT15477.1 hypothetical protein S40542_22065 [Pseudoalteromonas luteoviolacea]AOT20273.1 hypothetical protein S4054_21445 [Pseudoalteromonas luteoviolacea]KKE81397.1 hypothetical protein N479_02645 [Pseudoalteromonas luteoviolacea S4054]KZN71705.1 hypothetical protein N481_18730 [Pseudoalteromonas luteoviolacea S4047-1]
MFLYESVFELIGLSIIVGLGATVFMDIWSEFLKRSFGIQPLNYALVGRWTIHCLQGKLSHQSIANAKAKNFEGITGWVVHYITGVIFALTIIFIAQVINMSLLLNPLFVILFGTLTVCFPFFVMQPCFGMGIAASKMPKANIARLKSIGAHVSFGFGLYLTLLCLSLFYT